MSVQDQREKSREEASSGFDYLLRTLVVSLPIKCQKRNHEKDTLTLLDIPNGSERKDLKFLYIFTRSNKKVMMDYHGSFFIHFIKLLRFYIIIIQFLQSTLLQKKIESFFILIYN